MRILSIYPEQRFDKSSKIQLLPFFSRKIESSCAHRIEDTTKCTRSNILPRLPGIRGMWDRKALINERRRWSTNVVRRMEWRIRWPVVQPCQESRGQEDAAVQPVDKILKIVLLWINTLDLEKILLLVLHVVQSNESKNYSEYRNN